MKEISDELYEKLDILGLLPNDVRSSNVGNSDYSEQFIQAWTLWQAYPNLTPWDYDILKRVLRTKKGETRKSDYEKIIHNCQERIRQIDVMEKYGKKEYHRKPYWKPSEEQIEVLTWCKPLFCEEKLKNILESLIGDLKKLM